MEKFSKKKKDVKRMLRYAKEGYVKEQLETQQTNPRKMWRNRNKITGLGKTGKKGGLLSSQTSRKLSLMSTSASSRPQLTLPRITEHLLFVTQSEHLTN